MLNAQAADYKKPEFTLALTITGVGVDIRLNDISIERDDFGGHSIMSYDVNQSVIAGINELKVIAYPFFSQDGEQTNSYHDEAEVKAALYVNEQGDGENKEMLSQIHLRPGLFLDQAASDSYQIEGMDDVVLDSKTQPLSFPNFSFKHQIVATRKSLPVQSSYPHWAWQDGQSIEDTPENYDSLLAVYREIYEAFENKDSEKLLELHTPRSEEYAIAYHLEGGVEAGHQLMNTGERANNPNSELDEFIAKDTILDVYANGQMARIIDIAQYHPILFVHKTRDIIYTMKFGFYKNQNDEWIMIR